MTEGSTRRAQRRWSRRGTLLVGGGPQQGQHHGWEAASRGCGAGCSFPCFVPALSCVKARRAGAPSAPSLYNEAAPRDPLLAAGRRDGRGKEGRCPGSPSAEMGVRAGAVGAG